MKNFLSLLVVICICFCVVGCTNTTNNNSSELSPSMPQKSKLNKVKIIKNDKEEILAYEDFDSNRLAGIGEIIDEVQSPSGSFSLWSLIITSDGKLYEYTYGEKTFSNGKYYKEINNDVRFLRFVVQSSEVYIIDENFNLYRAHFGEKIEIINALKANYDVDYRLKPYIGKKEIVNIFFNEENDFFTINNNDIFRENELMFSIPHDETIERVTNNLIKTDKKYYHIGLEWIESEYVDVERSYKLVLYTVELAEEYSLFPSYIISDCDIRYRMLKGENIIINEFNWK